jgi:aromatic ring-opening dioxygenase catalytic subunit (LigB family)
MAQLVGVMGSAHAPGIARAYDQRQTETPPWKSFFEAYARINAWLKEIRPDVIVFFYNDHLNHFELSHYPTFALGLNESMPVLDEGFGRRNFDNVPGDVDLGWHLARSLVADEFDLGLCQDLKLDHGIMSLLPMMSDQPWQYKLVPIAVNVIQEPLPLPKRVWKLGEAVGRAIRAYEGDARVAVVSAGGLSHHLQGKEFGQTNADWDQRFMDLIEADPAPLIAASHADYIERGGVEGVEMMVWLAMRGAVQGYDAGATLRRVVRHYSIPGITACGVAAWEVATDVRGEQQSNQGALK